MRVKKRLLSAAAFFVLSLSVVEAAENDDGFTNFKTIEPERLWFVHSWHYSPPPLPKITPEEMSMTPGYRLGSYKRASRRDGEYLHVLVDSSCEVREGFLFWPYLACGEAPEIRVESDGFNILESFIKAKGSDKNLLRASHKDIFDALYGNGSAFVEVVNTVESLDKQAVKSYVYRYKLLDFDEKVDKTLVMKRDYLEKELKEERGDYITRMALLIFGIFVLLSAAYLSIKVLTRFFLSAKKSVLKDIEETRFRTTMREEEARMIVRNRYAQRQHEDDDASLLDQLKEHTKNGDTEKANAIIAEMEKRQKGSQ